MNFIRRCLQFDSRYSWEASPLCYIKIILHKAYKLAFLVRFGVSLYTSTPGGVPWLHGYGRNVAKLLGFLQEDPNLTKRRSVSTTLKLSVQLEASFEVCNVSRTQQACNWDDQNMVQMFSQCTEAWELLQYRLQEHVAVDLNTYSQLVSPIFSSSHFIFLHVVSV